ncbi:uncharacterized protein JCM6883_004036 [Sporobolomyces salmoneus]|uniref:uncharacterized protein n=1 Tax=Sporobolomyces salmoneus TaxID=183962 RepID=UPI003176F36C
MTGIAFIEKMLKLDENDEYFVRTCGEESHYAYNRVGLTEYFEHRNVTDLYLQPATFYADQSPEKFAFSTGEKVVEIDQVNKTVLTSKGNVYQYDILVLATGSNGALPPYVPKESPPKGIFVYRNIADLESIIEYAEQDYVQRASVVGGGLLGLEAAKAVYDLPTIPSVEILIRQNFPLNRQIDATAGELVLNKIEGMGVKVHVACEPTALIVEDGRFAGFEFADGQKLKSDIVVYGIGISPRDELAKTAGIKCSSRGGIEVDDSLMTSAQDVYAIGECASWKNNTFGLIGPGIEMADILAFNLTQTTTHAARKMNYPDLSTKLKLMGVDVASFGEFDADERAARAAEAEEAKKASLAMEGEVEITFKPSRQVPRSTRNDSVKALTYLDPIDATYKKMIFSADGTRLIGGILIGDTDSFTKLVSLVKRKKKLDVSPSSFILGKKGEDDSSELLDDDVICSCHGVTKGAVSKCVKEGMTEFNQIKSCTKAGTGCGGCVPLVTSIFKAEMKKNGNAISNNLCPHFTMSRSDLFSVIKIKKLRDFNAVMSTCGQGQVGCEICKPVIGSILASLYGELVMKKELHGLQDTNDRFLANIQRNGTFSVVPRIAGGEITPEKLVKIGEVALKYHLYTKITGGQRIDLFGARKDDLPAIWEELIDSGFESGHAYGKSLRTVKSCVGSSWCDDSVKMAIDLENRYRGIRSPHKIKGGISGCVRECAEAQSKDFGLIATDKGWNIYVGGNGGARPAHAQLLASDVPPSQVTKLLDRYLMFYVRTADRLQRTSVWLESLEGGIDKLRRIVLDDELGINADLEQEMEGLIGHYFDEWAEALKDPKIKRKFKQFANTDERTQSVEIIKERGQERPADWPKQQTGLQFRPEQLKTPRSEWKYVQLLSVDDFEPTETNTSSCAVKYGEDTQLAVFHVPNRGFFCTQQMCPHKRAFVLEHGIIGETNGALYVSCPLHKRNYSLDTGDCQNDDEYKILAFDVKEENGNLLVQLPPPDELDALIGSSRWMVRKAKAAATAANPSNDIDIVGPDGDAEPDKKAASGSCGDGDKACGGGGGELEW